MASELTNRRAVPRLVLTLLARTTDDRRDSLLSRVARGAVLPLFLLGALGALAGRGSAGEVIQVETESDQFGTGAACSLREALHAAEKDQAFGGCPGGSGADVIRVPGGLFRLTLEGRQEDQNATGDLDVDGPVTIAGAGASATVIDGGGLDRVIDSKVSANATILGLTIRGGRTQQGEDGAGIRNTGHLVVASTEIAGNESDDDAGGLLNSGLGASVSVQNGAVIGNVARGTGDVGGFGGQGGGFRNFNDARAVLLNVTISGNVAESDGGGVDNSAGTTLLSSVTVTGNTADSDGDGGGGGGMDWGAGTLAVRNSIVAANSDGSVLVKQPDCQDQIVSQGHNLIGDVTGCDYVPGPGDKVGTAAAPLSPGLGPLANNGGPTPTHALLPESPAVDQGNPAPPGTAESACPGRDQRGANRADRCDVGAYERMFCLGRLVNVVGTDGADVLRGTAGDDGVLALGGRDLVRTLGGSDGVCAGGGPDRVRLGGHGDIALGEGGRDVISGGGGADLLRGSGGKDSLLGGPKRDVLLGQGGNDRLNGGAGNDRCRQGGGRGTVIRC